MRTPPPAHLPIIVLLTGSVLWGLTWLPLKWLNGLGFEGVAVTTIAFGTAGLLLLPALYRQRAQWLDRRTPLILVALIGGYANLAFAMAMIYGEVVRVMVLFYLLPAWGVLGGRIFLGERIDLARWLAVALALTGAFFVLGGVEALRGAITWVDVMALTAGMGLAGNNLVFRADQHVPVPSKLTAMMLGGFGMGALLLAAGVQPETVLFVPDALWVAAYGGIWLMAATAATQWGVTHMEAGRASILIVMELVTAVGSAMLIAGERLEPMEWFGAVLILAATLIEATRATSPAEAEPEQTPFS